MFQRDGKAPGVPSEQEVLDVGQHLFLLEGEMLLELGLVLVEEAPDDLLLLLAEGGDERTDRALQPDQLGREIGPVRIAQVFYDVRDMPVGKRQGVGLVILEGVDVADQAGGVRVQAGLFGRLAR